MAPSGVNSATDNPTRSDMVAALSESQCRHRHRQSVGSLGSRRRRSEGCRTLADLEHLHGTLPISVTAQTGGGQHRVFSFHGENIKSRVKDIGDGLDVRATGGYIVAPPSIHKTAPSTSGKPVSVPTRSNWRPRRHG